MGQAQESDATEKGLRIGAFFSPDVNYRYLKETEELELNIDLVEIRNEREIEKFSFTTGFYGVFKFSNVLRLNVGAQYSNLGYQSENLSLVTPHGNSEGLSDADIKESYHYIGVPVFLDFLFGNSEAKLLLSPGIIPSYLIDGIITSSLYGDEGLISTNSSSFVKNSTTDFNRLNIMCSIRAGIDYKLNDQISFHIAPIFRYGVVSIVNAPISGYLWNGGVDVGISYQLY